MFFFCVAICIIISFCIHNGIFFLSILVIIINYFHYEFSIGLKLFLLKQKAENVTRKVNSAIVYCVTSCQQVKSKRWSHIYLIASSCDTIIALKSSTTCYYTCLREILRKMLFVRRYTLYDQLIPGVGYYSPQNRFITRLIPIKLAPTIKIVIKHKYRGLTI